MKILSAGWVVPVEAPPIRDGAVAVEEGRVVWVGAACDAPAGAEYVGPGVLLPGFVNAHCHLELTHLSGLDRSGGFVPWVARLVEERNRLGTEPSRAAALVGLGRLLESATVAVGDVSNALLHLDVLAVAPIEAVVFYELLDAGSHRAVTIVADALVRLAALRADLPSCGVHVRLGAHAPYSVSPELFSLLRAHGGPAFVHLAESPAEVQYLRDGTGPWADFLRTRVGEVPFDPPGLTPVQYLDALGVLHPGLVAAHCVQVGPADRRLLAARGVSAVLCPSSNRSLDVGLPDLPAMLADGVSLALGTDSLASGDTLDVRDEAVLLRETFPRVPAERIVHMLTAGGAAALALPALGTLGPGKRAALAYATADRAPDDPFAHVLARDTTVTRIVA